MVKIDGKSVKKYVSMNLQKFTFLDPQSYPGGKHKQRSKNNEW